MSGNLLQALQSFVSSYMSKVHTVLPGVFESYNVNSQKASVRPLMKKILNDESEVDYPIIDAVPVVFPRTNNFIMHFPIQAGDGCLLVFSEKSLEEWSRSADTDKGFTPSDPRKHDLTDAIAIPGLFSFNVSTPAENNDDFIVVYEGQKIVIKKNGEIEIGSSSLKRLVNDEFQSVFNNHTHSYTGLESGALGDTEGPSDDLEDEHLTNKVTAE